MDDFEEMRQVIVQAALDELGEEVIEAIRSDERDMIVAMLRSDEWIYESCIEAADAIEQLCHYPDEELH